jgi:hypothetical protein
MKGKEKSEVTSHKKGGKKLDRTHLCLNGDKDEKNDDDADDYVFKHKRNDPLVT